MNVTRIILALLLFLSGVLFFGSRDQAAYDDFGLEASASINVPPDDNGYLALSYMENEGLEYLVDECKKNRLWDHTALRDWDAQFANNTIAKNEKSIQSAIAATHYNALAFPVSNDLFDFPSYGPLLGALNLLLLNSMSEAHSGNIDKAIELAADAVVFSQRLKAEVTKPLISQMMGLHAQNSAMRWLHHLATDFELTAEQLSAMQIIFNDVPAYQDDLFPQVFAGEFVYSRDYVDQEILVGFAERWRRYWESIEFRRDELDDISPAYSFQALYEFLTTLFPTYYFHRNENLEWLANYYAKFAAESLNYCALQSLPEPVDSDFKLEYLVRPNSARQLWVPEPAIYRGYLVRRCLGHVQSESVKTVIALMRYRAETGVLPSSLAALVPDYLPALPIDAFNGNPLLYSQEKGFLNSVGLNGVDEGGAIEGYKLEDCYKLESCVGNPTVPIFPGEIVNKREKLSSTDCE